MNVINSNAFYPNFTNTSNCKAENNNVQKSDKKRSFLDKFETSMRNSADLNDTVQVPRTIFKGYLAFMAGAALSTLALIAKNNHLKNTLNVASTGLIIWGTFSFVRPYIIKTSQDFDKSET